MRMAIALAVLAAAWTPVAHARENRPLKCKISAARADKGGGGPALVAHVPKAMTPIDLNAVMMTDGIRRHVIVQDLFARRTEANTLEVDARLVNCTRSPLSVQVRSNFLAADQAPTEPASMWKTIFISPRSTSVYRERSIGTDAVEAYLIELRTPQ